jgi:hypothetical protein
MRGRTCLVAQRIQRFANVVGRERVAELQSLVEGARAASQKLWA